MNRSDALSAECPHPVARLEVELWREIVSGPEGVSAAPCQTNGIHVTCDICGAYVLARTIPSLPLWAARHVRRAIRAHAPILTED